MMIGEEVSVSIDNTENRIVRALAAIAREDSLSFRRTAAHWSQLLGEYVDHGDHRLLRTGLYGDHLGDTIENYSLAPSSSEVVEAIPVLLANSSPHGSRSILPCDESPWLYPNGFREHEPEHEDDHDQGFRVAVWAPRSREGHLSGAARSNLPLAQFRAAYDEGDIPLVSLATNWLAYEVMESNADRAWSEDDITFARTVLQRIVQVFSLTTKDTP